MNKITYAYEVGSKDAFEKFALAPMPLNMKPSPMAMPPRQRVVGPVGKSPLAPAGAPPVVAQQAPAAPVGAQTGAQAAAAPAKPGLWNSIKNELSANKGQYLLGAGMMALPYMMSGSSRAQDPNAY